MVILFPGKISEQLMEYLALVRVITLAGARMNHKHISKVKSFISLRLSGEYYMICVALIGRFDVKI